MAKSSDGFKQWETVCFLQVELMMVRETGLAGPGFMDFPTNGRPLACERLLSEGTAP